jgi:hypothetical protein
MSTRNTTLCGAYKLLRGQLDKTSLHGGDNSAYFSDKQILKIKSNLTCSSK